MRNFLTKKALFLTMCGIFISACSTTIQKEQLKENSKNFSGAYAKCGESEEEKYLEEKVQELLQDEGIYAEDLFIECKILAHNEGNRALRYLVGFGAGRASSLIKIDLFDKEGQDLGNFEIKAVLTTGFLGGDAKNTLDNSAKEIVNFIKKHYINKEKQ